MLFFLLFILLFVLFALPSPPGWGPAGALFAFEVLTALGLLIGFSEAWRPITLGPETLVIPKPWLRSRRIPVASIEGIGLVFFAYPVWTPAQARSGPWMLTIWHSGGNFEVARAVCFGRGIISRRELASHPLPPNRRDRDAMADWAVGCYSFDRLARSGAGKVASRLYGALNERQSPSRPLLVQGLQRRVTREVKFQSATAWAFWDPTGPFDLAAAHASA